jgi:hypothetical protein
MIRREEERLRRLEEGESEEEDEMSDVFENMEDALQKDYRHPIPTGIVGIDNLLKGGLGIGELAVVLAPSA